MASARTCPHGEDRRLVISGTRLREMFENREPVPPEYSRPEVLAVYHDAAPEALTPAMRLLSAAALVRSRRPAEAATLLDADNAGLNPQLRRIVLAALDRATEGAEKTDAALADALAEKLDFLLLQGRRIAAARTAREKLENFASRLYCPLRRLRSGRPDQAGGAGLARRADRACRGHERLVRYNRQGLRPRPVLG